MDDINLELRQLKRTIEHKQRNGTMPTFEGDKNVLHSLVSLFNMI